MTGGLASCHTEEPNCHREFGNVNRFGAQIFLTSNAIPPTCAAAQLLGCSRLHIPAATPVACLPLYPFHLNGTRFHLANVGHCCSEVFRVYA